MATSAAAVGVGMAHPSKITNGLLSKEFAGLSTWRAARQAALGDQDPHLLRLPLPRGELCLQKLYSSSGEIPSVAIRPTSLRSGDIHDRRHGYEAEISGSV